MATARAMLERRRSSRVKSRIPVKVFTSAADGKRLDASAETISVSRYGALLHAPLSPAPGSRVEILHGRSHEVREFRVICARDLKRDGLFELGVEIFYPARNFWGVQFPEDAVRPASPPASAVL
jgi:hypothetical protein